MNEIVIRFLLAGDTFMPEMHLRFTYSACGKFTKSKESIQKFKEKNIHEIFLQIIYIKLVFNVAWLMEV